jgi:hypothetical protein
VLPGSEKGYINISLFARLAFLDKQMRRRALPCYNLNEYMLINYYTTIRRIKSLPAVDKPVLHQATHKTRSRNKSNLACHA